MAWSEVKSNYPEGVDFIALMFHKQSMASPRSETSSMARFLLGVVYKTKAENNH